MRLFALAAASLTLVAVPSTSYAQLTARQITEQAKVKATGKQWAEAFNDIDLAAAQALAEFNEFLKALPPTAPEPGAITPQQKIVEHFEKEYFPVFQTGYAIALGAQLDKAINGPEIARRAAFWALNGKGMAREIIATQLRAKRKGDNPGAVQLPVPVKVDEIQQHLPRDFVLIEIIRFDNIFDQNKPWYGAVVIPGAKGDLQFVDLNAADPTDDLTRKLQANLEQFDAAKSDDFLKRIQTGFYAPLFNDTLKNAKRWIISPTADLWLIPYPAMKTPDDKYVIEKYVVSYEIAGRDVRKTNYLMPLPPAHVPAFIMGIPDFDANLGQVAVNDVDSAAVILAALAKNGNAARQVVPPQESWDNEESESANFFPRLFRNRRYCPPQPLFPCFPEPTPPKPVPTKLNADLLGGELEPRYDNGSLRNIALLPKVIDDAYKKKFPNAANRMLVGAKAREDIVKAAFHAKATPKTLALITHGFFVDPAISKSDPAQQASLAKHPDPFMRCGMILSGYNQWARIPPTPPLLKAVSSNDSSDGILTGREVVERCNFSGTELVALIGCGTGVGQRFFGGDSLASLRYSFTNAGGPAVLGSSWSVRVAETAQLMNLFFETQATHEAEPDVVLQQIQAKYIQSRRDAKSPATHFYYWASFSITR